MLKGSKFLRSVDLVKSFHVSVVLEQLKRPHDLVFARFVNANSVAFFSWPGLGHEECADAMLAMPAEMRTCHTVFGRPSTAVHLALDVDCAVPPQFHTVEKATAFRRETVTRVVERLDKHIAGHGHRIRRQLVLLSPNLKKCSVHVHVALEGCIFANHHALAHYLQPLAKDLPEMDMNIFRNNGTLRCFQNRKVDGSSELVLYDEVPGLNVNTAELTPRDMMQMSFIVADQDAPEVKQSQVIAAKGGSFRYAGTDSSVSAAPISYPSTYDDLLDGVKRALGDFPNESVVDFKQWVGVGLKLKLLSTTAPREFPEAQATAERDFLEIWDDWSKRAPLKYKRGECTRRWATFRTTESERGVFSWKAPYAWMVKRSNAFNPRPTPVPTASSASAPSPRTADAVPVAVAAGRADSVDGNAAFVAPSPAARGCGTSSA